MPSDVKRTNVLGVGISSINMHGAVSILLEARARGNTGYVCVTGVHGVIESQRDPELKDIHNHSFLTVPDGMPTVWMGREQGFVHMGRVYGPDLMREVCRATSGGCQALGSGQRVQGPRHREPGAVEVDDAVLPNAESQKPDAPCPMPVAQGGFSHFLYGSTPEVLGKLKANLEKKFPGIRIVGTFSPPFRPLTEDEERELQKIVAACRPDFFWVGLSTPKQERFMASHDPRAVGAGRLALGVYEMGGQAATGNDARQENARAEDLESQALCPTPHAPCPFPLDCGIMLGVGAAFDIHAGLLKDAPEWIKSSGLQWFYRLCQEPRRLWRRYLDIVPRFLWLAALQMLGIRKFSLDE